jgi:hypothetical protein
MAIIVPNTASTLSSAGCIVGSADRWCWVGLRTPLTASGSVTWYRSNSAISGSEMFPISLSPGMIYMYGPFNSPDGIFAAGISGGCAIVWMKEKQ